MPLVSITRRLSQSGIVSRLKAERIEQSASSFAFFETEFDASIAETFLEVLQFRHGRRLTEVLFTSCPGNEHLTLVLQTIVDLDLCSWIKLYGDRNGNNTNYIQPTLEPFGSRMGLARNLHILNLKHLTILPRDAVTLKLGIAENNHLEKFLLTNIRFREEDTSIQELAQGLASNKNLRVISLISCAHADKNVALLLDSLESHPSLTTLQLFGNHCRDLSLAAMARLLATKDCKLTSLDMHNQCLNRRYRSQRVEGLGEQEENVEVDDAFRIQVFNESWPSTLYRNKSLKRLVLAGNRLSDDDMQPLAMLLRRLASLETLDLDNNSITDAGVQRLADHATVSSRLRVLRLTSNRIQGGAAASAMLKLLKNHPELHRVTPTVLWTSLRPLGNHIKASMDQNGAGRVLLVDTERSKIALGVWPTVLARNCRAYYPSPSNINIRNHANSIFYLLRNGPVLLERPMVSQKTRDKTMNKRKREEVEGEEVDPFDALLLQGYNRNKKLRFL